MRRVTSLNDNSETVMNEMKSVNQIESGQVRISANLPVGKEQWLLTYYKKYSFLLANHV